MNAVAYARTSWKDQAAKGLSVPAQLRRIEDFARRSGITIVYSDADDGVSAYKDNENRDAFWRCIERACTDTSVRLFLVDDPQRFVRDKYLAGEVKARLRRAGVRVLVTSNPYDTSTIQGVWQEAIDEARSQTGSMEIAFYTIRGMEQNAQTRDPVTGWAYKNGGKPPYGYRTIHVVRSRDSRGRDIMKALWEIEEAEAAVLRYIYRELRLGRQMSYHQIRQTLNSSGSRGPEGRPWSISMITELFRENRVFQYAGRYYWNKEDHRTPGRRFKDQDKWTVVEGAHPAIITLEEAEAIVAGKVRVTEHREKASSPYLFTGKNLVGEPMFVCALCGARMTSWSLGKRYARKYVCGGHKYRDSCEQHLVPADGLESSILSIIRKDFANPATAEEISKISTADPGAEERARLQAAIKAAEGKIRNLIVAVAEGFGFAEAKVEIERLKEEKSAMEHRIKELEPRAPLSTGDVLRALEDLEVAFMAQENEERRNQIRLFVRSIVFDPRDNTLKVRLWSEPSSMKDGAEYVLSPATSFAMIWCPGP